MPEKRVVDVEVYGQRYPIKTTLDSAYVHELAAYVHRKMDLASEAAPASDTLALAILAALNIADELFRSQHLQRDQVGSLTERTAELERIVDEALQLAGAPSRP